MKYSVKDLKVLYEDNHLLAVNKPAGLLTQPNDTSAPDLETLAKAWIKEKYNKKGSVFLHPVHRLDKPVSGIVLFARTSKALSRLNEQMRAQTMTKTYIAKVEGHFKEKSGELHDTIIHSSHRAEVSTASDAKSAHLSYRVVKEEGNTSLLHLTIHTGRYHQIRIQCAHAGHPIVGDTKYGSKQKSARLKLHHTRLVFEHPVTKETITLISEPDFT